jgi:hypothetical protein
LVDNWILGASDARPRDERVIALEIGDSHFFSLALKVLAEEGEALAYLDGRTVC